MKMKTLLLTSAIGLTLSAPAAMANEPSFSYVSASYVELDEADTTFDGFQAELSGRVGQHLFISGSYAQLSGGWADVSNVDFDIAYGRLGIIFGETDQVAFYAGPQVQYINADFGLGSDGDFDLGSESSTDYGAFGGARLMLTSRVELNGEISYVDMDNDDYTSYSAGARVYLTPYLAATGQMNFGDLDGFSVGVHYRF
ncbi:hypothetical protein CWE09_09250 [Aliidiomarina minuta]|uniref:Outer membrane protein beta-barrel domain-containing protein n=1 Tax=Aliidiomarina minuta TaxID=880057 RepID=A0A432WA49_9GAMM|nr:outer membrane beta-barrel protein [Aliidiomarina minuta]RUO26856.1 hypothetical protein CWE09_09250 [Aliidiomarina minuta]